MSDRLEALVENAISRTLAGTGLWVPLSVRHRAAQAAVVVVREWGESAPPACLHLCGHTPAHECTGAGEHSLTIVRPGGSEYRIRVCWGCYDAEAAKTAAA